jgi:uncharacterized protein YcfL
MELMKRLMFTLPLVAFLFVACSADSVIGLQERDELVPADGTCNPNVQPC